MHLCLLGSFFFFPCVSCLIQCTIPELLYFEIVFFFQNLSLLSSSCPCSHKSIPIHSISVLEIILYSIFTNPPYIFKFSKYLFQMDTVWGLAQPLSPWAFLRGRAILNRGSSNAKLQIIRAPKEIQSMLRQMQ